MMAVLKKKVVDAALQEKGFNREEGSKHIKFKYRTAGNRLFTTVMSRGAREIDNKNIGNMARQCGINSQQFKELIDCTLTQEEYEDLAKCEPT